MVMILLIAAIRYYMDQSQIKSSNLHQNWKLLTIISQTEHHSLQGFDRLTRLTCQDKKKGEIWRGTVSPWGFLYWLSPTGYNNWWTLFFFFVPHKDTCFLAAQVIALGPSLNCSELSTRLFTAQAGLDCSGDRSPRKAAGAQLIQDNPTYKNRD